MNAAERTEHLSELPLNLIGPEEKGALRGFIGTIKDLASHRELLDLLIRRELKSRYKDSRLGFAWSFIRPITQLLIYYIVIGKFLGGAARAPQFAIFVFSGLTIWGLYLEIITSGTGSILGNAALIKKVYLPREIFPLSVVGSALFNFAMQFGVLLIFVIVLGQFPWNWNLLLVPASIGIVVIYGLALAILLSAGNVFLRDIRYLVDVAMLVAFWASPIVYPWSTVSKLTIHLQWVQEIYLLNPVTSMILAFQKGIWAAGSLPATINGKHVPPTPWPPNLDLRLLIIFIIGLLFLWFSQRIFARVQGNFAQEI